MSEENRPHVLLEIADGVASLILDSPHNRNALSERLVDELLTGLTTAVEDDAVRVIVLTHTGGTFCAGADLTSASGAADQTIDPVRRRGDQMLQVMRSILECPKPVIGRIDGHVRAGGMGLVAACDIVVAGPSSTFGLTESRLGLAASVISLTVIPRLSSREASRMFLTGDTANPETALTMGLVTEIADDTDIAVGKLCASLAKCSAQGLAESKKLVNFALLEEFERSSDRVLEQSVRLFHSEDAQEGMSAFLGKRRPRWVR